MIGIYKITNKVNGKIYIGETMNIEERWEKHKTDLRNNSHHSYKLQNDWNKYGENNFLFETIFEVNSYSNEANLKCFLIISEYRFMKKYDSISNGYNIENTYEKMKKQEENVFRTKSDSDSLYHAFIDADRALNINEHIKDEKFINGLMSIEDFAKDYLQYNNQIKNQEKCFDIVRHILRITNNDYTKYILAKYDFDKYVVFKDGNYYIKKEIKTEAINRWLYFNINCNTQDSPSKQIKKKPIDKEKFMKYYNNKNLDEIIFSISSFNFNDSKITLNSFCKSIHINNSHIVRLVKKELGLKSIKNENERVLNDGLEIKTIISEFSNEGSFKTLLCDNESKQFLIDIIKKDFDENIE